MHDFHYDCVLPLRKVGLDKALGFGIEIFQTRSLDFAASFLNMAHMICLWSPFMPRTINHVKALYIIGKYSKK